MKYFVDINAQRNGNGAEETPFKSINEAAQIARAGDEVIVAPGIYREYVDPKNAGTEDAPIVYRSSEPLGAVITGSEKLADWEHVEGNVWRATIDNGVFGTYNPYTEFVCGDWYFGKVDKHTGAVWVNDQALYETVTLDECKAGEVYPDSWETEKSVYKWYTEQDEAKNQTVIYVN